MNNKGIGFEIKLSKGSKLVKIPLDKKSQDYLNSIKHPVDYLKEYINEPKLYAKIETEITRIKKESVPKNLDCKYCKGEGTEENDKACTLYYMQMDLTLTVAINELVNMVKSNAHLFAEQKQKRTVSYLFFKHLTGIKGKGLIWFDFDLFNKDALQYGLLSVDKGLSEQPIYERMSRLNELVNDLTTKTMINDLYERNDPNNYNLQKRFFNEKIQINQTQMAINQQPKKTAIKKQIGEHSALQVAYFIYYIDKANEPFLQSIFPSIDAWNELSEIFDKTPKNIQKAYLEINKHVETRLKSTRFSKVKYVHDVMLKDYPEAQKLALLELKSIELNR